MKCASFRQAWFRVVVAKLLIVDDHPLVRRGIVEVLAEAFPGGHVAEASDGAEALQAVNDGAWDLVVLDLSLPGRPGLSGRQSRGCLWPKRRPGARRRGCRSCSRGGPGWPRKAASRFGHRR